MPKHHHVKEEEGPGRQDPSVASSQTSLSVASECPETPHGQTPPSEGPAHAGTYVPLLEQVTNEVGIPIMMRDQTRPPLDPLSATEISTVQVIGAIPEVRENKPLTKQEVCDLVREIARHPKLMEKKVLRLTEELNKKLDRVESLLQKLE
ncbi:hypothetical protein ZIOFF_000814 [Zingiber officinale]|uniref:Uncharacterized protein n=1 Tax=Zingiber officinale TaxID=94328 RepID=A0A8J5M6V2_ZINOF|nr:hypothetical protein ZIOFF_000814 [Zingiber officinale]